MIIEFENGLKYDVRIPFSEQDSDVIEYINSIIESKEPILQLDENYRVVEYVYKADKSTEILRVQEFSNPAPSCEIKTSYITVRGVEVWHDKAKSIQIILTFQQQIDLLTAYPEFAVYTSQSELTTFVESDTLYTYDNTLCDEYRQLVQFFGGIINDKNV